MPLSWSTMPIRSRIPELVVLRVEAEHRDLAGGAGAIALEDLDDRRLAGAVGAQEPEDGSPRDREVDAGDGLVTVVGLAQTADPNHRIPPIPGRAIVARSHGRQITTAR